MKSIFSLFIIVLFFPVIMFGQNKVIDSLINLKNTTSDTTKILAVCELIERKIDINDIKDIENLFEEGIKASEKNNFTKGLVKLYGHYEKLYYFKSDYDKSIEFFFKSLKYAEKLGDKLLIAKINHNISNIFFDLENYKKAREYTAKSLKIGIEINSKRTIYYCYLMYGNCNYVDQNIDSTEYYYKKALSVYENVKEYNYEQINDISLIYNNFGALYTSTKKYDKAIESYYKALKINKKKW